MKRSVQTITQGDKNVVGKNIREIRLEKKLTQEELMAKLEVKGLHICSDSICRIEKGTRQITDFEIIAIAYVLKVPVARLFEGTLSIMEDDQNPLLLQLFGFYLTAF